MLFRAAEHDAQSRVQRGERDSRDRQRQKASQAKKASSERTDGRQTAVVQKTRKGIVQDRSARTESRRLNLI